MKTEKEINEKIIALIGEIQNEHPELYILLNEMPITNPKEENPEINLKILRDYYESLLLLLKKYRNSSHEPE